jgi:hypothetical protein
MGLTARGDRLVVVHANRIELRREKDLAVTGGFDLKDAKDTALSATGNLWVLAGHTVRRYTPEGKDTGIALPGLGSPTSLSFDNRGRLLVTDNGPRQQVLFYDVSHTPKLVATFGEKGGLLSGVPGLVTPKKLFALVGAGTDAKGSLTVGMSFGNGPNGHCFLRSFTPAGNLRWELYNASFVDTYGFDPASDGSVVYGRTAAFDLDLTRTKPGGEATLKAITLDPLYHPDDPRQKYGSTAILRRPGGKRVLYTIGQYAGGYRLYTFDEPNGYLAHPVHQIGPKKGEGEQWAWDVDEKGGIWHGDAPGKTIRRYAFKGWNGKKPVYDWAHPQTWPWPDGWEIVRRIEYDAQTDALYLSGYLKGDRVESWGIIGATMRRYDGWMNGAKSLRWTMETPRDGNPDPKEGPLSPSSVDLAGDYLFFGMVKPTNEKEYVHIFRPSDGRYIGSFEPGASVVGKGDGVGVGWLDMPYSLQAMRRKNGEYLVLVEEDWRGKNLLYRWTPDVDRTVARKDRR